MVMEFCKRLEELGFKKGEKKSTGYFYSRIAVPDKLRDLAVYLNVDTRDIQELVNIFPKKDGTFEVICFRATYDADAAPAFHVIPLAFAAGKFRSYDEPLDDGARKIKAAYFV